MNRANAATVPRLSAEADKYEIYAVRFATLANFPVSSLIAGADRARRMDIAMMIWVLKGADGRIALVDSGFHRDRYFSQFAVRDFVSPSDALTPLALKPTDVTDIFLSHMHAAMTMHAMAGKPNAPDASIIMPGRARRLR